MKGKKIQTRVYILVKELVWTQIDPLTQNKSKLKCLVIIMKIDKDKEKTTDIEFQSINTII